jgi:hypothetical protein
VLDSRKIEKINSVLRKKDINRWQAQHNLQSKGYSLYNQVVSPVKRAARKILGFSRQS